MVHGIVARRLREPVKSSIIHQPSTSACCFPPPQAHNAAMRKRVQIVLAGLLTVVVGAIVWQVRRDREPVYQRKPLSSWLVQYSTNHRPGRPNGQLEEQAETAICQIGTNAIPTLLRMLRAKDSALKVRLMDLVGRQHIINVEHAGADFWNVEAAYGFRLLGTNAQSALPALIEIANQHISEQSKSYAIDSLGSIGPSAKEAVPLLLGWATHADDWVRLKAITSLGLIQGEPDRVVPVLINALHDPRSLVQRSAVKSLEQFGPDAKLAVPALVGLLNAQDPWVTNALKAIDPDAAAKAGVN